MKIQESCEQAAYIFLENVPEGYEVRWTDLRRFLKATGHKCSVRLLDRLVDIYEEGCGKETVLNLVPWHKRSESVKEEQLNNYIQYYHRKSRVTKKKMNEKNC